MSDICFAACIAGPHGYQSVQTSRLGDAGLEGELANAMALKVNFVEVFADQWPAVDAGLLKAASDALHAAP